MKALVYTGEKTLAYRDEPDPQPGAGDALITINHVGICGSDMHAWAGHDERRPAPLILGHEAAGVTADGRRVTVNPLVACGVCPACLAGRENLCPERQIISMPPREGAFAEALVMPEANLVEIPDHVSTEVAALAEPLACGWHAVRIGAQALALPVEGLRCLVFGGGAIGLGAARALLAQGAGEVWLVEPHAARRTAAEATGGIRTFDPVQSQGPEGVDLVIDGVGIDPTRAHACRAVRPGGAIVHIGLGAGAGGLDVRRMTLQEIAFIGTYTYTMADFRETAQAIFDGRLGALDWPEIRSLSEGARAFEDIAAGLVGAPKIILAP